MPKTKYLDVAVMTGKSRKVIVVQLKQHKKPRFNLT